MHWYYDLLNAGCICKGTSSDQPSTSEQHVDQIREAFIHWSYGYGPG